MKMVLLQRLDHEAAKGIVPDLHIMAPAAEEMLRELADADILIGKPKGDLAEVLAAAPRLRWMHVSAAGVDALLVPELIASPVVLTCAKDGTAGPVLAEHAFALVLSLSRHVASAARASHWDRQACTPGCFELGGKTIGIIGFGGAGREIARIAQGFGMNVLALKRHPDGTPAAGVTVLPPQRLHELLEQSDVVAITVPSTPQTDGMFNREVFAHMRPKAILVNVGRGATVVTDDLVQALEQGRLAGAGLDVVEPEPLPQEHPLWRMPNVVITPHIAGSAPERGGRNQKLVLENLRRFAAGQPLRAVVDKQAGY